MDSFEWNKIAGAVLAALLVSFGLSIFSEILFETETPESPGYVIAVAEREAGEETAGDGAAAQPIAVLLASADPAAGEASAKKCAACHTFAQGEPNKIGPNLWEVINRPVASVQGYEYSEAMRAHAQQAPTWTFEALDPYLHDPKGAVPGTKMAFAGLKNDPERANVIAYLRTLSASPAPLPEAPPPAAEGAPAPDATAGPEAGAAGPGPGRPEEGVQAGAGPAAEGAGGEGGRGGQDNTQPQGSLGPLDSTTADQQGGVPQVAPIEEEAPEPGAAPSAQGQSDPAGDGQAQPGAPAQPGTAQQAAPPADPQARTPQPDVAPADAPDAVPAQPAPAQVAPTEPAPATQQPAAPAEAAAPAAPAAMPRPEPPPPPTAAPQPAPAAAPAPPAPAVPADPAAPPPAAPAPDQQGAAPPAAPAQQVAQNAAPAQPGAPATGGFVALVAAADPTKGQAAFRRCLACHTVEKDGGNKIGPKLWGVLNRPVAAVPDYAYSEAMKGFSAGGAKAWTVAELDAYLLNPKAHVPGTKMVFPGIKKDDERASVVAYLRTLADAPAPLQ